MFLDENNRLVKLRYIIEMSMKDDLLGYDFKVKLGNNEKNVKEVIKAMEKLAEKENYILEYKIIDTWENEKI